MFGSFPRIPWKESPKNPFLLYNKCLGISRIVRATTNQLYTHLFTTSQRPKSQLIFLKQTPPKGLQHEEAQTKQLEDLVSCNGGPQQKETQQKTSPLGGESSPSMLACGAKNPKSLNRSLAGFWPRKNGLLG